jgi:hypothetical protein
MPCNHLLLLRRNFAVIKSQDLHMHHRLQKLQCAYVFSVLSVTPLIDCNARGSVIDQAHTWPQIFSSPTRATNVHHIDHTASSHTHTHTHIYMSSRLAAFLASEPGCAGDKCVQLPTTIGGGPSPVLRTIHMPFADDWDAHHALTSATAEHPPRCAADCTVVQRARATCELRAPTCVSVKSSNSAKKAVEFLSEYILYSTFFNLSIVL